MTPMASMPGSVPFNQFAGKNSANINYQTPKVSKVAKKKNRNMQDMIIGSHSYHNRRQGSQADGGGYTSAPNTAKKVNRSSQNLAGMKNTAMPMGPGIDN